MFKLRKYVYFFGPGVFQVIGFNLFLGCLLAFSDAVFSWGVERLCQFVGMKTNANPQIFSWTSIQMSSRVLLLFCVFSIFFRCLVHWSQAAYRDFVQERYLLKMRRWVVGLALESRSSEGRYAAEGMANLNGFAPMGGDFVGRFQQL